MAKQRSAGDLFFRVVFEKRADIENVDGNTLGDWEEQFQCRAGFTYLRGGESVMADRLQNKQTVVVFVRNSIASRTVTTEWQMRDMRTGIAYAITDITITADRLWVDLLCQSGVASG